MTKTTRRARQTRGNRSTIRRLAPIVAGAGLVAGMLYAGGRALSAPGELGKQPD